MNDDKLIVRRKGLRGEDGYKTFSIRIKETTVEQLDTISAQTNRSRNELIGMFLDFALERCVVEESPASYESK